MKKFLPLLIVLFLLFLINDKAFSQILPPYGGSLGVGVGGTSVNTTSPSITPSVTLTPTISVTPIISPSVIVGINPSVTPINNIVQNPEPSGPGISIGAVVGDLYLSLSGFSSPFATVDLTSSGLILRSTVSDQNGKFSISQILIRSGFSEFCLKSNDFRNLGESNTCIKTTPITKSKAINNIFLPPTLALWKKEVAFNETGLAFGYTMPNSTVVLHINNSDTREIKSDNNGYFRFLLKLKPGKYNLYVTAKYNNIDSKSPSNTVKYSVLTGFGLIIQYIRDLFDKLIALITSWSLWPVLLVMPIIILIIILIIKLWGERLTNLVTGLLSRFMVFLPFKTKKLHHYWFVGY